MKPELSNSFCYFPFYHLAVKDFKGDKAEVVAPCCNMIDLRNPFDYFDNDQKGSFEEYFYSKPMEKLRKDLLEGKKPKCCNHCWKLESKTKNSQRLNSECDMPDGFRFDLDNPKLVTVDFATGRTCNLSCRMCSPGSSDKLDSDYYNMSDLDRELLGWENVRIGDSNPTYNPAWQKFLKDQNDVTVIKVIGGEPFVTKDFIDMLHAVIKSNRAKDTELIITTNATKFSNTNMELLNHFKHIRLLLSIDSVGKSYEYIRHPMPWSKLQNSIENFKNKIKTSYEMIITTPVMIFNLMELKDLSKWAEAVGISYVFLDTVKRTGRGIDIVHLPQAIVDKAYGYIANNANITGPGLDYIKYMTSSSVADKTSIINELHIFDKLRNQNYENFLNNDIVKWLDGK